MLGFFSWKQYKLKRLLSKSADKELAIIGRHNPSSDSIASALAFKRLAEHFLVDAKIFYTGTILNKTLQNLVGEEFTQLSEFTTGKLPGRVALIDTLPDGIPAWLKQKVVPSIVIARSPAAYRDFGTSFGDIRDEVETTSSILVEYLEGFHLAIDKRLATLLLFAIRERTSMLMTRVTKFDLEAYYHIHRYIDPELLVLIEHPQSKAETFSDLSHAIDSRLIKGPHLFANAGYSKDPGSLQKVCRYMLDLEGITTALVVSVNTAKIHIYCETKNIGINVKGVLRKAFGEWGDVTGESGFASATMPLGLFGIITGDTSESKKNLLASVNDSISSRYFSTMESEGY
ncbi:MAG TPA: hypothetical protein HA257_00540 [Candidatus Methanoperedenaceae archaeon]|nr:hypothetical protein [Candidatus Methanoperedenaceae archaeon]